MQRLSAYSRPGSIVLLLLASLITPITAHSNALDGHSSPYLRLHADDPINWQDWQTGTLAAVVQSNKLVYVSSGYFSCHWCRVMHKESYLDPEVAEALNASFIAIKVDREFNPDVDQALIAFMEQSRGAPGWPANVFLTPDGYPIASISYTPRDRFLDILATMSQRWTNDPAGVKRIAVQNQMFLQPGIAAAPIELRPEVVDKVQQAWSAALTDLFDPINGGFGTELKFPHAPALLAALQILDTRPDKRLAALTRLTLDRMAAGNLHDHVHGGFFRYTTDPLWREPHFEKMLSDNALLAQVYLRAGVLFDRRDYIAVGIETLEFMARYIDPADGGLITSFSAVDDNDRNGGHYFWSAEQLRTHLNKAQLAAAVPAGAHPGPILPTFARSPDTGTLSAAALQARTILAGIRPMDQVPRDSQKVAGLNGLALAAFADGYCITRSHELLTHTRNAAAFIAESLWSEERLWHSKSDTGQPSEAVISDYAYIARGLRQQESCADETMLTEELARTLAMAWSRYSTNSGWNLSAGSWLKYTPFRDRLPDVEVPSPTAVLLEATLGYPDAPAIPRRRAEARLREINADFQNYPMQTASLISAIVHLTNQRMR